MNEIFLKIAEISATTSVVILLVAVLSKIIDKKFISGWKYWIWLIIALRLMVPFNPGAELFEKKVEVEVPNVSIYVPAAFSGGTNLSTPSEIVLPEQNYDAQTSGIPEDKVVEPTKREEEGREKTSLLNAITFVWISGAAIMFLWNIGAYILFRNVTLSRSFGANQETKRILSEVKASLGIEKEIKALVCKNVKSPMVMGFLSPRLILPGEDYSEESLRFILRHELTHYKRRDTLYKAFMLFVNAVHWFNPAVWLMRKLADSDLEVSCDSKVVSGADLETRKRYSETILSCVHREKVACAVFSTHFYGGTKTLKKRFANILSTEKRGKGKIAFVLVLVLALVLGGTASCTVSKAPTEDQIRELVLKADAVYQPGDDSVLEIVSYENYIDEIYYDEIGNFEEAVSEIFSEKGIEQILNSKEMVSFKPAFFEEEGRYYRYSCMADSARTNYYYSIEYISLEEEEENRFRYAIGHSSKGVYDETEFFESYVTIVFKDGKYLIEDFDSKRFTTEEIPEEPEIHEEGYEMSWAREIYNSDLMSGYVELIKERVASIKDGTWEGNPLEPSDYPEDFPPVEDIPDPHYGNLYLAWRDTVINEDGSESPGTVTYVLDIDETHAIVFEPMMFMLKPGDEEGELGISHGFVHAPDYGYETITEWFLEAFNGYYSEMPRLSEPKLIANHIAALNQLSYGNYGAICEERYGTFLFKERPEYLSDKPDDIVYGPVTYDGVTDMHEGYYLDPFERTVREVLNFSSLDEMYGYMEQYISDDFLYRGYNSGFMEFGGKLYKTVGNIGSIGITYGNSKIVSETENKMTAEAEVYAALSGERIGDATIEFEKFGDDWKIVGVIDEIEY